ncbi:hypothetical protein [Caballeronia glebae]|nr:hypothetical protein [Caballeronia glebae]
MRQLASGGGVAEGAKVRRYDANAKRLAFDVTRAGLANEPGEGTPATP